MLIESIILSFSSSFDPSEDEDMNIILIKLNINLKLSNVENVVYNFNDDEVKVYNQDRERFLLNTYNLIF